MCRKARPLIRLKQFIAKSELFSQSKIRFSFRLRNIRILGSGRALTPTIYLGKPVHGSPSILGSECCMSVRQIVRSR